MIAEPPANAKAKRLTPREKTWLGDRLAKEQSEIASRHGNTLRGALTDKRVFTLAFINLCNIVGSVGIGLWLPQIIKGLGMENATVGFVTPIPYIGGACAMTVWARLANRSKQRMPYVISALMMAALALVVSGLVNDPFLKVACLSVAVASILSFQATFWAIPSTFLTGRAAAGGLALIVSIGNLGGFAGPSMIGFIRDISQNFTGPLFAVAGVLLVGAVTMFLLGDPSRRESQPSKDQPLDSACTQP